MKNTKTNCILFHFIAVLMVSGFAFVPQASGGNYQAKIQANLTAYHSYLLIASAYNIVNSSGRMSLSIDKIS